jgi:hypothetical protein
VWENKNLVRAAITIDIAGKRFNHSGVVLPFLIGGTGIHYHKAIPIRVGFKHTHFY